MRESSRRRHSRIKSWMAVRQPLDEKVRAALSRPLTVVDITAVTASFGLCGLDRVPVGGRKIPEHMLKVADAALYKSKHAGRNRVTATILQETPPVTSKAKSAPLAKSRAD